MNIYSKNDDNDTNSKNLSNDTNSKNLSLKNNSKNPQELESGELRLSLPNVISEKWTFSFISNL
jgi:hypothetical protein